MFEWKASFDPKMLGDVLAMRMGRSVAGTVRTFTPDPRVAQMIDHFTQYVGSSPYGSPAVLCGIAHMQTDEGIWYPMGGTRAVPEALEKLARELGVEFRTGTKIEQILTHGGEVTGVRTDAGEEIALQRGRVQLRLRAHPSRADQRPGRRRIRAPPQLRARLLRRRALSRTEQTLRAPRASRLRLQPRPARGVRFHLQKRRARARSRPAIWRPRPAPSPAPRRAGGEALYVLVHTPYLRPHHDWKKMLPAYRRVILDKLKRTGHMPDLESRIVFERTLTPQDIHDRYHVLNGAIYGLASHGKFLGAFKPGNRSPDLRGLYLAGGAAHPGPGMPMVLMSGWIAADALDRDAWRGRRQPRETGVRADENDGRQPAGSAAAGLTACVSVHGLFAGAMCAGISTRCAF